MPTPLRSLRLKPWQALLAIAILTAAIAFGLHALRPQAIRSGADMVALLPKTDATLLYADVSVLRRAGMMGLFAGSQTAEEPEYRDFLAQTHFDYTRDIDSIAASVQGQQAFFIVRGHFDWARLRQYAATHGGTCQGDLCNAPTSKPGRWASFLPIQTDTLALALDTSKTAAKALQPSRDPTVAPPLPPQPVWVSLAPSVLRNADALPPAAQIFAAPLAQADRATFSIGGNETAFTLQMSVQCSSESIAQSIRERLQDRTRLLQRAMLRQQQQSGDSAALLSFVLAGKFEQAGNRVVGIWPLRRELLKSFE